MALRVSIVIPTHGEAPFLAQTLASIAPFSGEDEFAECVVVHNGGTSASFDLMVEKSLAKIPEASRSKFMVIEEAVPSSLAGRHRGFLESSGDVLAFTDDDVVLGNEWFEAVRETFASPETDVAGGPSYPRYHSELPPWTDVLFEETPYGGRSSPFLSLLDIPGNESLPISPLYVWSLNLVIRRDVLERAGGFHPCVVPPDSLMFGGDGETGLARALIALGSHVLFVPQLSVTHIIPEGRLTWAFLDKRSKVEGVALAFSSLRRNPDGPFRVFLAREIWGQIAHFVPKRKFWSPTESGRALRKILAGTISGWFYLYRHHRANERVREWVAKATYWDYAIPKTAS